MTNMWRGNTLTDRGRTRQENGEEEQVSGEESGQDDGCCEERSGQTSLGEW